MSLKLRKETVKVSSNDLMLRAEFQANSYNSEKRTIDLVWTTEARVKRYDWWEDKYFWEELGLKEGEVRMKRMNNGAPVLNNHNSWNLESIMGVVESARLENLKGYATVRFSERDELKGLIKDIQSGVIRNVSVGYRVHRFEEQKEMQDGIPVMRAVDWEPYEISFVGIPADADAQVRNQKDEKFFEITTQRREENMGLKNKPVSASADPATRSQAQTETPVETTPQASAEAVVPPTQASADTPAEEATPAVEATPATTENIQGEEARSQDLTESEKEQITEAEITRQSEIRSLVRVAKLEESFADELVKSRKMTVDEARKEIFKKLEQQTSTQTRNGSIQVKDLDQKKIRTEAATSAILHRFDPQAFALKQENTEFRQGSLIDMARHFLHLEGVSGAHTMSRSDVVKRALHTTSDFAEVLANVANKTLRAAYEGAPNTYEPFTEKRSVSDFKEISSVQLSNGGKLEKVNESGEYKRTTVNESAEKYKVEKYGIVIGKTYELMMNDDLDAFTRIPMKLGVRAREKENEIFWSLVIANGLMAETGQNLFSVAHDNFITPGAAISVASLAQGRAKMRVKKDLDGELMNLAPAYIVTPAALETVAEQFIAQAIIADQAGNTNPFYKKLQHIVEPRLDANSTGAWYLFANKAQQAIAEMALLEGKGPEMFTREGFDVDGMELKVRHHFGMKIVDYRGAYKNAGG